MIVWDSLSRLVCFCYRVSCVVGLVVLLAMSSAESITVTVGWDTYVPNVGAPPIDGFLLERSIDKQVTWQTLPLSILPTDTSASDTSAPAAPTLTYYRLRAFSGAVQGPQSNLTSFPRILDDLALWWKFNDGPDTPAADSWSGGHLGTLGTSTAAPTWTTDCQLAGCLSFDGTADYVTTPHTADLDLVGDMTIAAWVNVVVATDATTVAQKEAGGTGETPWLVEIENTGTPHWLWYHHMSGGNFDAYLVFTTHTIPTGTTWQHLAFVRTVATKTVALYVNGTLSQALTYATDLPMGNTVAVTVGGRPDNTARSLNGAIDDFRVYSRALSSEDVTALYQWTDPWQILPTFPPPVALRLIR
jgi:hypothetical protein